MNTTTNHNYNDNISIIIIISFSFSSSSSSSSSDHIIIRTPFAREPAQGPWSSLCLVLSAEDPSERKKHNIYV